MKKGGIKISRKHLEGVGGWLLIYVIFGTLLGITLFGMGAMLIYMSIEIFGFGGFLMGLVGIIFGLIFVLFGGFGLKGVLNIILKSKKAIDDVVVFLVVFLVVYAFGFIVSLGGALVGFFNHDSSIFLPSIAAAGLNLLICFISFVWIDYFSNSERVNNTLVN